MTAPTTAAVRSAETIADTAADLSGVHPGLDLITDGIRLIATDPTLTPDRTQTLLACLAGGVYGEPDVLRLLTALVAHLGDPDTNPALATLPADRAERVAELTARFARETNDWADLSPTGKDRLPPRGLCSEAPAVIDGI